MFKLALQDAQSLMERKKGSGGGGAGVRDLRRVRSSQEKPVKPVESENRRRVMSEWKG